MITDEEKQLLDRDGFVVLQNVLTPDISFRGQGKELVERNHAFPGGARNRNSRSERQQHRREI